MRCAVNVEIEVKEMSSNDPVVQHPLGSIAKGKRHESFRACFHVGCCIIQRLISQVCSGNILYPSIKNSYSINTKQNSDPLFSRRMIYMRKSIDARFQIITAFTTHSIYNS